MVEEWKMITGSNNAYVSNLGNIKQGDDGYLEVKMSPQGYYRCHIPGIKQWQYVHRLVAAAFVPNDDPENKIEVNHIDGNRCNNKASNLEYCSHKENMQHAAQNGLLNRNGSRKRPIIGFDTKTTTVSVFDSEIAASKYIGGDLHGRGVAKVLHGQLQTYYGWYFQFLDQYTIRRLLNDLSQINESV